MRKVCQVARLPAADDGGLPIDQVERIRKLEGEVGELRFKLNDSKQTITILQQKSEDRLAALNLANEAKRQAEENFNKVMGTLFSC